MTRLFARLVALTLAAGLLVAPAIAQAKPAAPKATAPKAGTTVSTMPALTWDKASGAVSYQLQIATDAGFNPALVDVTTANLRFINSTMLSNGAYFWRVRSVDKAGGNSKWTSVRKFTKKWSATATILSPANLSAVAYPTPTILSWTPVPGAASYKVSVATGASGGGVDAPRGIISTGALAWSNNGPIATSNTNLAVSAALHPGTYYWQVIPVDAQGHDGTASAIFSFTWIWAGLTTPTVSDLVDGVEIYDPLFQWPAIPGAASYQIEVNPTSGFAPGSLVLSDSTSATSYAPTKTLPNNTYYWRVRGVDPQGQAGPWNNGPAFTKTYDETPLPGPANLHVYNSQLALRDNATVNQPVVEWSTVPGARTYEVQVSCTGVGGGSKSYFTANTAWTPLSSVSGGKPNVFSAPSAGFEMDSPPLVSGPCFIAVRAYADNAVDGSVIAGHFAFVDFTFGSDTNGAPTGNCGGASCQGTLSASDLVAPANGQIVGKTPLLCWKPADMDVTAGVTGSTNYFVQIARDATFTNGVQGAYTSEPCWAPSKPMLDEGTLYYWQVVPTDGTAGGWGANAANSGGFQGILPSFQHASVPPTPISPVGGAAASEAVVFHWSTVPEQVRNYTIEIAQDASFSTVLESATTDATSYSATKTFPVGATVYWRVRVNNDDGKGLAWSATSTFVQTLPAPAITTAAPFSGATFPALSWTPVDGASSYETQDVYPDGSVHVTSGIPSTAISYTKMTGLGHGTVQVRAVFGNGFRSAYTATRDVVHTIPEPGGTKTQLVNKPGKLALTFAWNSKTNAKQYKVQVSRAPGFTTNFVDEATDQSSYTPLLTQPDFGDGGTMYWRVAVIDPDGNVGAFSKAKKFTILARLQVALVGQPPKGQRGVVTVTVTNAKGKAVKGAAVKLGGAGVKTGAHRTDKKGVVTFSVKPTKAGNLAATVTKKLFKTGSTVVQIA